MKIKINKNKLKSLTKEIIEICYYYLKYATSESFIGHDGSFNYNLIYSYYKEDFTNKKTRKFIYFICG